MAIKLPLTVGLASLAISGLLVSAESEAAPKIDKGEIYFELNHTDGDLGIHGRVGADPWKRMLVFNHRRQLLLDLTPGWVLAWEGMSEISFESAEPNFDYLPPAEFFGRYPEGNYSLVGFSIHGQRMNFSVPVSHLLPAPAVSFVNGEPSAEDCDGALPEFADDDVVIHWEEVTHSHPTIGRINEPTEIESYEVVIEVEDADWKPSVLLPPDATEFEVPEELLELADDGQVKYEIIARGENKNQTAIESCFLVDL